MYDTVPTTAITTSVSLSDLLPEGLRRTNVTKAAYGITYAEFVR